MSRIGLKKAFSVLLAAATLVGVLAAAGVLSTTVVVAVSLAITVGLIVFLVVRGVATVDAGALVIMLVGAFGIAPALAPTRATEAFYSAAAQVIPVLLLALGLEVHVFRVRWDAGVGREDDEPWASYVSRLAESNARTLLRTIVLAVTLLLLIVGELQALDALASQEPNIKTQRPCTSQSSSGC